MDDVEVDVVDAETAEAPLGLCGRVLAGGIELRGDEHLFTRDATLAQPLADTLLVPIRLGCVDVAVAELERRPYGVHALGAVRHLPDAEAEHRHLGSVAQQSRPAISNLSFGHEDLLRSRFSNQ
ncbi:MAG TPA: hypothetical protein VGF81_13920 [Solirubrobacteraceae bacterium]